VLGAVLAGAAGFVWGRFGGFPGLGPPLTLGLIPHMVARARPAVVTIFTTVPGHLVVKGAAETVTPAAQGLGSGFVIDPKGQILTNDHVVAGASDIQVKLYGSRRRLPAQVVGSDPGLDLALLRVKTPRPLPVLTLGHSEGIPVGAWDVAIGNPEGLQSTVTVGVLSAQGRSFTIGNRHYRKLLQTDAPINPGNSGGPLLDLRGRVIGINTAVQSPGYGLGFAIPISEVRRQLPYLRRQHLKAQGWLGIQAVTLTPAIARQANLPSAQGVLVAVVLPGSPAQAAGLQPGDTIVAVNGRAVRQAAQLVKAVEATPPRTAVRLRLIRGGALQVVKVVTGSKPRP
jgi:serine protease Do